MKMTEIERELITVPEFAEPCAGLAAEAQEVLGYSLLKSTIAEPAAERSTLQLALAATGIEILKTAQVKAYQREMLQERTTVAFNEWLKDSEPTMFFGPGWAKTKIDEYKLPIPEFVLNKAIQIKKQMPEVRIYVEHLSDHPDPFLVVAAKHESYNFDAEEFYVEVWEEPKFEGRIR